MSENQKRLLFLCAHRSVRELMAASLLAARAPTEWDIWIAPAPFAAEDVALVRQVLEEISVLLISSAQTAERPSTTPGMRVLCFVVAQLISDRSFPTPVGVNYGQLKMLQGKRSPKKSRLSCIAAFGLRFCNPFGSTCGCPND